MSATRWEVVAALGLGAAALFLGETMRREAVALASLRHASSSRAAALRTFDAAGLDGRPFRVHGDATRVLLFDDGARLGVWRPWLLAAADRGIETYVVCVTTIDECRKLQVAPPTRVIAYIEWKYLPALAAIYDRSGALVIGAGRAAGVWVESAPATDVQEMEWKQLLFGPAKS